MGLAGNPAPSYRPVWRDDRGRALYDRGFPWGCVKRVVRGLSASDIEAEEKRKRCAFAKNGAVAYYSGAHTGRAPQDRYWVCQLPSSSVIEWNDTNRPISPVTFDVILGQYVNVLQEADSLYVYDGFVGGAEDRMRLRVVLNSAVQYHFCMNMFISFEGAGMQDPGLFDFEPELTLLVAGDHPVADWAELGLNSSTCLAFNMEKSIGFIGGTQYCGEIKKMAFSVLNYKLPLRETLSMHCAATRSKNTNGTLDTEGHVAVYFGLSGTGKTTLASDPGRALIGDDEHGWGSNGVFNLEGGCYAKCIDLDPGREPVIFKAIQSGSLLENVILDDDGGPAFANRSITENTRVSYSISSVQHSVPHTVANGHPSVILFLTCDAFGVMPPVSRLTVEGAMYHFMSGFSAKVAGTEQGVAEPSPTFSPMFGGAFMPLAPIVYANLLRRKLVEHPSINVWLVNTGWQGGPPGVGSRIALSYTRAIVEACLDGTADQAPCETDPIFNVLVPTKMPGVNSSLLNPRCSWESEIDYEKAACSVARLFQENWTRCNYPIGLAKHGPQVPCVGVIRE